MPYSQPSDPVPEDRIDAVRRFNRFHTRLVGALNEGLLASAYSLPQVRILYEIANAPGGQAVSAAALGRDLALDAGYLSRLISGLEKKGLLERAPSRDNAKRLQLSLTERGRTVFSGLNAASAEEVSALLAGLSDGEQRQLVGAMTRIERLLGSGREERTFILRDPEPGDLGWITHRHGVLYAREYGWDRTFEALVAEITSNFARNFDSEKERCWVADRDGEVIGSVFLVRENDTTAKLRLLYVEPSARGLGLGRKLVDECMRFARSRGYSRMVLWTNDILVSARRIYEATGFSLIEEEPHHSFGHDLIGQIWARDL
jgi:DNA-binding MarR family transcriptional regulator/GNAT superfamily N-acetyltransferase